MRPILCTLTLPALYRRKLRAAELRDKDSLASGQQRDLCKLQAHIVITCSLSLNLPMFTYKYCQVFFVVKVWHSILVV